ncbi:hypothetical protein CROQUDRAFT_93255 [Cronartium quercuum f. sp. fusiforme G11]|uniref:Uncharacterized protein n=1 Tax=Cronartium quercuum f. sp. fusiforme G11 TaxID=708437 RepID=A0A9P6NHA1_9BASI|nr:hypothetical protein CROQUDRAFT_93255 [Cronartium quercuum f. sp. fusiforme G11]
MADMEALGFTIPRGPGLPPGIHSNAQNEFSMADMEALGFTIPVGQEPSQDLGLEINNQHQDNTDGWPEPIEVKDHLEVDELMARFREEPDRSLASDSKGSDPDPVTESVNIVQRDQKWFNGERTWAEIQAKTNLPIPTRREHASEATYLPNAAGKRITRFSGQAISPAQGGYSARQNWGRRSTPDLRAFSVSLAQSVTAQPGEAAANGRRWCDRRDPDSKLTGVIARFTPASEKSRTSSGKALRSYFEPPGWMLSKRAVFSSHPFEVSLRLKKCLINHIEVNLEPEPVPTARETLGAVTSIFAYIEGTETYPGTNLYHTLQRFVEALALDAKQGSNLC